MARRKPQWDEIVKLAIAAATAAAAVIGVLHK